MNPVPGCSRSCSQDHEEKSFGRGIFFLYSFGALRSLAASSHLRQEHKLQRPPASLLLPVFPSHSLWFLAQSSSPCASGLIIGGSTFRRLQLSLLVCVGERRATMKVLCDVCGKEGASVLCCADEAALCDACDRRVHRANKLAGKHRRFSLSAQSHPACDICQEKRGFLFCQEDRAILCRDCDASVHGANRLTMKHNRFILTGDQLSADPISSSPSPESTAEAKTSTKSAVPMSNQNKAKVADGSTPIASTSTTTSSISEYLTKTCPGWRVEDLLVDDAAVFGVEDFAKGDELLPFLEADLDGGWLDAPAERFPVWAPHVPQYPPPPGLSSAADGSGHRQPWQGSKEAGPERWSEDASFTVPQISPASTPSKRPRHSFWYY